MNLPVLANFWLDKEPPPRKPIRVIGIDLGTTNSTVAEIMWSPMDGFTELPKCRCLEIDQPTTAGVYTSPLIPSVVAILPKCGHWVGEGAKRLRTRPQESGLTVERTLFFDTKNEMGLRKTYFRADEAFNHASKIAGHILSFLKKEAQGGDDAGAERIVVTVPASFQLSQRLDTLEAAALAGITINDHDLLDEPTAALIDYLFSNPDQDIIGGGQVVRGLVFDFGGGTCDVSVVEIQAEPKSRQLQISALRTSRYHRLGGGDLDAAIVHERLIPDLLKENGLKPSDLSWVEKKKLLEPALLGTAEALKIALCMEIDRLQQFGKYDPTKRETIASAQPGIVCKVGKREFRLTKPQLNAEQWEKILEPFLDRDCLYARETEYRLTQSIFAPIADALERVQFSPKEMDFCLLVGGSTLIPQVQAAFKEFFSKSKVLTFPDNLSVQTAVARGAAWHAFYLAVTGKPLVQPVVNDTIAFLTGAGDPITLIKAGTPIPYPSDGSFASLTDLVIPQTMLTELKLEVVALSSGQPLLHEVWQIESLVSAGDSITVEYRLGGSQEFVCRAFLTAEPQDVFEQTVQNPLSNVVNPQQVRLKIEEKEEELRQKGGGNAKNRNDFIHLARWYAELRQYEKAVDILQSTLRLINRPDDEILNLQGIYYGELHDFIREEKAYREAAKLDPSEGGSLFNLSLSFYRRSQFGEALALIQEGIQREPGSGAYFTQKGRCLQALDRESEAKEEYQNAIKLFGALPSLSDWELGWRLTCAVALENAKLIDATRKEQIRRNMKSEEITDSEVLRPDRRGDMVRRPS